MIFHLLNFDTNHTNCNRELTKASVVLIEKQGISKKLFKVAKPILVLPHSNAGEERVFSMVRKNKTTFRSSLSMVGSLSSILTILLNLQMLTP